MGHILRWLKVYEEESKLFVWVALLLFFINVASILINNYAETAFLKRFGVQYLPVITAINAIVTFVLLSGLGGRLSRIRGDKVVAGTLVAAAGFCALMRFVVPFDFSLIYPVLYILKTQFTVLMAFLFWNLANDLFSARQSKRLFPLITTGGILGAILGSFATPLMIRVTEPDNLLLLFPLIAGLGAACSLRLGNSIPGTLTKEKPKKGDKAPNMLEELRQVKPLIKTSTLAQVLLLLSLLPNIVIPILNYQFSYVVNMSFTTESSMIDFYSYFRGAQNIIALVLSLFVGRIYSRFGLPVALMFHPANYIFTFCAFLFQFNIFTAVYSGVSVGVLRKTINAPASAALYGLLLPKDRALLRPFLRGTVVRIGILFGSGLLWVANEFISARYLSFLALGFSGLWLASIFLLKREYSSILISLVQNSLPEFHKMGKEFKAIFKGAKLGHTLLERFQRASGEEARWCADMLQNTEEKERLDDVILEKLQSADDGTRILLLPYLSDQAGSKVVEIFLSFKDPNKPELMLALAQTARRVFADMPAEKEQEVFELATIPEVKACFLNWMNQKDPEQFDRQVETWLSSDKKGDRRAGILAIGEVGSERHIDALDKVLASETEPCVLALTLHGLRRFQTDRRVVELVKPFLRHPEEEVRLAAIEALPLDEDVEVNTLIQAIGDPAEKVRTRAIERLVKLPAEKQHLLVAQMGTHSRWVRDGLFEIAEKLDLKNVDVFTFCRNQIKVAYEAVARSEFIAGKPETPATRLMLEHLEEVRKQRVINAIMGVAAKDPEGQVAITLRGLNSDKERDRSDSIEALETLLDKPLANLALPQLDNRPNAERLAIGRKLLGIVELSEAETIKACLNDPSWVTVIMTLECLATWKEVDRYRDTIENIAASDYGGVAHTAKHALHSADGIHEADLSCLIDRINNIRKVELFAGLTIGQLAAVAWQSDVEAFGPDQVVASAERPDRGLLMVVAGEITFQQVHKDADSTRELHRIGAGDWFGAAIMFGMKPPASLVAKSVGEVLLIHLDRETFHSLANQYPGLALQVCNGLAKVVGDVLRDLKSAPRDPEVQKDTHTTTLEGSYCTSAEECSLVDRIFFLRQIDLFSQLDNASVTALAMIGEELALEKGDQVLGSDVGASGLFLIPHGDLSFHRGQELFDRKGPGGYFGLPTLFGMPVDDFVVTAEEKTRLIRIPPEEFRASVMDHPIIAIKACEKLSQLQGSLLDQVLQANEDAAKSGKTPG